MFFKNVLKRFARKKVRQPVGLISVLLDADAEYGDRDDAAMDLGTFENSEAERELLKIVLNHSENADLVETATESLSELWNKTGWEKGNLVSAMHPKAREFFGCKT